MAEATCAPDYKLARLCPVRLTVHDIGTQE